MRVEGPKRSDPVKSKKPASGKSASDASFAESLSSTSAPAAQAGGVAGAGPLTAVDAILSLQAVDTATEGRSKGLQQAKTLLDGLEEIRRGLLTGMIPVAKLKALVQTLDERRSDFQDPKLAEILGDIELRARVELAKLGIKS